MIFASFQPGLCNKIRDEALTHHKSGQFGFESIAPLW